MLRKLNPKVYCGKCYRCNAHLFIGGNYPVWGTNKDICMSCFFELSLGRKTEFLRVKKRRKVKK